MSYFDKPSSSYCGRDGKTHRSLEGRVRRSKHYQSIQKSVFGLDNLSKKKQSQICNISDFVQDVPYTLKKSRRWELVESPSEFLDRIVPPGNEFSVGIAKELSYQNNSTFKSLTLKQPNHGQKSIEVASGKGATLMSLRNELIELEPKEKGRHKRKKSSAMKAFSKAPSVMFVVDQQFPSDYVSEASIYKWRCFGWPYQKLETKKCLRAPYLEESDEEEPFEEDFDIPSASFQTNISLSDCFVQKNFQDCNRRKKTDSFNLISKNDSDFDKVKRTPKVIFDRALLNFYTDSIIYVHNGAKDIGFEQINYMFDFLWLNEEQTKCLFIIPKALNQKVSNFDSFMILEFFGNRRKRLRVTISSTHYKTKLPLTKQNTVFATIKSVIMDIWNASVKNSEDCQFLGNQAMVYNFSNSLFSVSGNPVGDFDLLLKHQVKIPQESDIVILTTDIRCNLCECKNAALLSCGHSFCHECSSKFIRNQIEDYADVLCCSLCDSPLEPIFVFYSTPLLILRAYLRSKFFEKRISEKCPNCNVNLLLEVEKAQNVKCTRCSITFCTSCKQAPHFPIPCSKAIDWKRRMLKEVWFNHQGNFKCFCKKDIDLSMHQKYLEYGTKRVYCRSCGNEFKITWPQTGLPKFSVQSRLVNKFLHVDVCHFIADQIASTCTDAFLKRISFAYQNKMVKNIVSASSLSAFEARRLVFQSLYFLEYGKAYCHYRRKRLSNDEKLLRNNLQSVQSLMWQIEGDEEVNADQKIVVWQKLLNQILQIVQ